MLVSDLLSYDLVPSEVAALRSTIPERLRLLQELAVRRGLLGKADLFVVGPPGSGKSTLVELLSRHAEHVGERVIVVRPEPDFSTLRRLLLSSEPAEELQAADLVIIDELEALRAAEPEALLPRLLQRIQLLKERRTGGPRLVVFSAPLEGVTALAARFHATLVESPGEGQEVPHGIGTLCDGRASFATRNATSQRQTWDLCLRSRAQLFEMLLELGRRGPTLILSPDEASCVRLFCRLSASAGSDFPSAARALRELPGTAPGRAQALLNEGLRHGIALYGPSLSPGQTECIEAGLKNGEVRLLFAPLAEAMRLGLLATSFRSVVIHARWRWQRDPQSGRFVQVALDHLELSRLSRLAQSDPASGPGPLLVYARSPREAEEIWQQQIEAPPRPLSISLPPEPTRRTSAELLWRRWADANRDAAGAMSPLELLCVTALGPLALGLPLLLSEQPGADYGAKLAERVVALKLDERPLFSWLRSIAGPLDHETLRAVKRGLLLIDWVDGVSGTAIEDTYHVWVGLVGRLAADCADRLEALGRVCASAGWSESAQQPLRTLSARLRSRPVDAVVEHDSVPVAASAKTPISGRSVNGLVAALRAKKIAAEASLEPAAQDPVRQITRERRR